MGWPTEFTPEVHQALLAPFDNEMIEVREGKFFYVDARAVQRRLDDVVGPMNWSFTYEVLHAEQGGVVIKGCLSVFGILKCDAGEHWRASDRDKIEVFKAAVSDAFKRAAVQFGIGRYLYELEVERAGKMTPAERDAAARRAGYVGETGDPEVHDYPCSQCAADVPWDQVKASRRKFNGKAVCSRCAAQLSDGPEPTREAKDRAVVNPSFCSGCGDEIQGVETKKGAVSAETVVATSMQRWGASLCHTCGRKRLEIEKANVPTGALVG